jgi:hypothetical protein
MLILVVNRETTKFYIMLFRKTNFYKLPIMALAAGLMFTACNKEEELDTDQNNGNTVDPVLKVETFNYNFNNGQVVSSAPYSGMHMDNFSAQITVEELSSAEVEITVNLMNTVDGEMYMIHAHDAADPSTTPNGTPYNETPNGNVFVQMLTGNGGEASVSQTVNMSFTEITEDYEGFFVVHDPLQQISTTDISTYLVVGSFARQQAPTDYESSSFTYDFNTGQVDPSYTYSGMHDNTLSGMLKVQELADGKSRVSVALMNTINGETYMVHAHDMADPSTTPNGTPYDETPNGDVLALMIEGNGMTAHMSQISTMTYADLTSNYEAFFVVHDPLQMISTTDPTTYVLLGVFAN